MPVEQSQRTDRNDIPPPRKVNSTPEKTFKMNSWATALVVFFFHFQPILKMVRNDPNLWITFTRAHWVYTLLRLKPLRSHILIS